MVNETFAREVLGGAPAVGQRVRFVAAGLVDSGGDDVPWEVIGVVGDVTYRGLAVTVREAEAFAPVRQIDAAPEFALNFPLVTSHIPDLLDNREIPDDAIIAVLAEHGESRIGPLDEVGRSALRDHLYTAGELLRMNQLRPDPSVFELRPEQLRLFDVLP